MAQGLPAADSSIPVSADLVASAMALMGATPAFWGRYFTSISTSGSVEYRHAIENPVLGGAGIRLLPVCRQTTHVAGDAQQGYVDGMANAQDFIETFGVAVLGAQGGVFYMFLDVEGDPQNGSPSLNADYYTGWSQGLAQQARTMSGGTVQIMPCLYGAESDQTTWDALAAAVNAGAPCRGVWVARYYSGQCTLGDWLPEIVSPKSTAPFTLPILAWQYAQECLSGQIDCSQINPGIDAQGQLLQYLVLPPAA